MRDIRCLAIGFLLLLVFAAVLSGCGSGDKTAPGDGAETAAKPSGDDEEVMGIQPANPAAVPLEQALKDGLCEIDSVQGIPFNSRYVRFLLKPKVDTKPVVRVEAGWDLRAKDGKGRFVTVLPAEVELYAKNNTGVDVFAVELEHSHLANVDLSWARLSEGDALLSIVRAADGGKHSWNAVQIALDAYVADKDLKATRGASYSAPRAYGVVVLLGEGGKVAPDVGALDEAAEVLRGAGLSPTSYKMFNEAEERYTKALEAYRSGNKPLQPLETLGWFRTRDDAFNCLAGVWTDRMDDANCRRTSIRWLGGMIYAYKKSSPERAQKAVAALKEALARETDEKLKKEIQERIDFAAK